MGLFGRAVKGMAVTDSNEKVKIYRQGKFIISADLRSHADLRARQDPVVEEVPTTEGTTTDDTGSETTELPTAPSTPPAPETSTLSPVTDSPADPAIRLVRFPFLSANAPANGRTA